MTEDDRKTTMDAVEKASASLAKYELARLERAELGDLHFGVLRARIENARLLVGRLTPAVLSGLSEQGVNNLHSHAMQLVSFLETLDGFSIRSGPDPSQKREQLIQQFESNYTNFVNACWLPSIEGGIDRLSSEVAVQERERISESIGQRQSELDTLVARADALTTQLQELATKAGTQAYAATFDNLSERFRKSSVTWLVGTGVAALAVLVTGFTLWTKAEPLASGSAVNWAPAIASKLTILSVLFFVLVGCARNYRAAMHNATINTHRAVALRTFQLFTEGASDDATKSAVLLRATEAIFQPQDSGYQTRESDPSPTGTVLEILRKDAGK